MLLSGPEVRNDYLEGSWQRPHACGFFLVLTLVNILSLVAVLIALPLLGQEECYAEFITYRQTWWWLMPIGYGQEADGVINGMEFLKTLPFVDSRRIVLVGVSYRGAVSLFAAANSPEEFVAIVGQAGSLGASRCHVQVAIMKMMRAGSHARSPILIQRAENDMRVSVNVSVALRDGLVRMGKDVTLRVYPRPVALGFDIQPRSDWVETSFGFLHNRFGTGKPVEEREPSICTAVTFPQVTGTLRGGEVSGNPSPPDEVSHNIGRPPGTTESDD